MDEGEGRYTRRPLITFAEDPVLEEDSGWTHVPRTTSTSKPAFVRLCGMKLYRCGGGYRVVRRSRGNY